jgi:hypothetical protein
MRNDRMERISTKELLEVELLFAIELITSKYALSIPRSQH